VASCSCADNGFPFTPKYLTLTLTQTKRPEKSQQYLMRMVGINPESLKQAVQRLLRVKLKDCISQIHSDLLPKACLFWIHQNLASESSPHNLLGCVGFTSFVRRQVQHYQTISDCWFCCFSISISPLLLCSIALPRVPSLSLPQNRDLSF
jgi:hypothetical protein